MLGRALYDAAVCRRETPLNAEFAHRRSPSGPYAASSMDSIVVRRLGTVYRRGACRAPPTSPIASIPPSRNTRTTASWP